MAGLLRMRVLAALPADEKRNAEQRLDAAYGRGHRQGQKEEAIMIIAEKHKRSTEAGERHRRELQELRTVRDKAQADLGNAVRACKDAERIASTHRAAIQIKEKEITELHDKTQHLLSEKTDIEASLRKMTDIEASLRKMCPVSQHKRYYEIRMRRIDVKLPSHIELAVAELRNFDHLERPHQSCGCRLDVEKVIADANACRRSLHCAQSHVRVANSAKGLEDAIADRDVQYREHEAFLASAVNHRAGLEGRLRDFQTRRDTLVDLLPCFERRTTPELETSTQAVTVSLAPQFVAWVCQDALAAFRDWEDELAPACVIKRTDGAMRAAHVSLVASGMLNPDNADGSCSLEAYEAAILYADEALETEDKMWSDGALSTLPVSRICSAAKSLFEYVRKEVEELERLVKVLFGFAAELEHLRTVSLCPEVTRDRVVQALKDGASQLEEAIWERQDATVLLERARKRKRDTALLETDYAAKKQRASESTIAVRKLSLELAMLARDFPEVLRELRAGLPENLLGLWCEGRTLASYSQSEALDVVSRNVVYRVEDSGRVSIVKEYPMSSASLSMCLREASLLHRLRHPHVVEILSIFEDAERKPPCFYIEMPYYEHGQIDHWIRENAPDSTSIRRALQQVMLAVQHLHRHDVVHNDIKPANILIESNGCARLADFDVSVDVVTRTTEAVIRATAKGVGTLGYFAPEIVETGSTKATDMYAFGKTLAAVFPKGDTGCEKLVKALTDPIPSKRLDATGALQHDFFKDVFAWQKQVATGQCNACFDEDVRLDAGVRCPAGHHLLCVGCFSAQVASQSSIDERGRFEENSCAVVCQFCPADKPRSFSDSEVALRVPDAQFALLLQARTQVSERKICAQQEDLFRQRVAAVREELQRANSVNQEVHRHRLHIVEHLLTLKCPRCHRAFVDFDGCFALKCSGCRCGFCAWCMRDCGRDAHAHVLECLESKRRGHHHASFDQFTAAQRVRRQNAVMEYLQPLDVAMRTRIVEACARDFADLGLVIQNGR